ncbi:MAG: hypothetical protein MRECE_2c113 [Mycoplasmataceae bacterium CE_OT135]|nr:MAG: hypothetical protein MRECE_2c113 [Mycoplasmataceae bacterium CE_OT135]
MVNAQEWLDKNYPQERRRNIIELNIANKNLEGSLVIRDWPNLKAIVCSNNKQLTNLTLINLPELDQVGCILNRLTVFNTNKCLKLTSLDIGANEITNLDFLKGLNPAKLKYLHMGGNKLQVANLTVFRNWNNLENLWIEFNPFYGSLEPLRNLVNLKVLNFRGTNINFGLEYLPENLLSIWCSDEIAKQLKDYYEKPTPTGDLYNLQAWREAQPFYKIKLELEKKLWDSESQNSVLQRQLAGNLTIITKLKEELNSAQSQLFETNLQLNQTIDQLDAWQRPVFWPQPTLGQPDSAVTFRTQVNSFDVLGTAGLCLLARHLYRKYKNSRQGAPLDEERQPLLRSPEEIVRLNQETNRLKSELSQIAQIISPNEEPRADVLKQEIARLKYQELASQVREEKAKFEQLITDAKNKVEANFTGMIDLLLETQKQINKIEPESNEFHQAKGQLTAYQSILEGNLTKEELQALLTKQTELSRLEKHLESLQQNQEQVAQIIQPAYGIPSSSKGSN